MKRMISNYRFWVLFVLSAVAMITILSEPTAVDLPAWVATFIISKIIGVVSALCAVYLFRYWAKRGEIDCLTDLIKEDE